MTVDNVNNLDLKDLENYLKNIKNKGCDENDLNIILNVLQCPVFKNIVTVQNSLKELQRQCLKNPNFEAKNFNFTPDGKLELIDLPPDDEQSTLEELNESKQSSTVDGEARFWEQIEKAAAGRMVAKVDLYKSQTDECLGINFVGLRARSGQQQNDTDCLGIFVQNIAKNSIADREGTLQIDDQILAINKEILNSDLGDDRAIEILQNARGHIKLIVAKSKPEDREVDNMTTSNYSSFYNLSNSVPNDKSLNNLNLSSNSINESKNELELNEFLANEPGLERFSQIELIELVNTGKGLGFGILGGKSSGVLIKTILPGGVSDQDGRLKSGDHILQINNVSLRGMSSEQVAQVLKTAGTNVKLLVARQKMTLDQLSSSTADHALTNFSSLSTTEANNELISKDHGSPTTEDDNAIIDNESMPKEPEEDYPGFRPEEVSIINQINEEEFNEQEVESIEVELVKDTKGLGITIAGYVCEKENISGIYVKSIAPDSAADLSGKIQLNDQIIEVDGISLLEFTNHEAVEVLKHTGKVVKIKLARYLKGNKYDRLQLAINNADYNMIKPVTQPKQNQTVLHLNSESRAYDNVDNDLFRNEEVTLSSEQTKNYWQSLLGDDVEIVIAQFSKFEKSGGLGISVEGTIEEEPGKEAKPHHYIEKISKDGPIGMNGILKVGDEILEVNNTKVYNMEHMQVVRLLKELDINVRMVCARLKNLEKNVITLTQQDDQLSHQNLEKYQQNLYENYLTVNQGELAKERLVKAKSDGSLAIVVNSSLELLKIKSRSLEPLSGLAMWNSSPVCIELEKAERGLGFSILDYQDPLSPNQTVIVIRSLVQGGVAQQSGVLLPGDRLLAVNDISLENACLDLAVKALKGAPKGTVKLLVAKPLPITEQSTGHLANINLNANISTNMNANVDLPVLLQENIEEMGEIEQQSDEAKQDCDWKSVDLDDFEKADLLLKENLEKSYINKDDSILINRSRSYSPLSMQFDTNFTDEFGYTELPIPIELERLIVLHKKKQSLGITLELSEQGINGLIVRSLAKKGLIYRDGRLQIGDNLVSINHESLRNTTTSKAKAIFKRVSLVEGDIPLKYVPECESICYRRNTSLKESKNRNQSLPCFKNYCRTPSPTFKSQKALNNPFFQ